MNKSIVLQGVTLFGTAIILGAFGAHLLKQYLTQAQLASFETGVKYQFYAGLFLLVLGLNHTKFPFKIKGITTLFFIGTLLFSVSIYGLTILNHVNGISILGPITPLGGTLMIAAVMWLIVKIFSSSNTPTVKN